MGNQKIRWLKQPEEHDYPAAESYLTLMYDSQTATKLVRKLRKAKIRQFKSKDLFRASNLPLLTSANLHVRTDLAKLLNGERVSPLLLVRRPDLGRVIIADGYHRMCAVYSIDEDVLIQCKIVS